MLNAISDQCQTRLAPAVAKVVYMETFKARMKRIRLRAGFKSQGDAAAAIGCERGTVGMWEAPSSNVSAVGEFLLSVAKAYKVRPEWINDLRSSDDGYPWVPAAQPAPPSQSQSLQLDPVILAESIAALRQVAKSRGWSYDPQTHAAATCYAYELWQLMPSQPSTADVIDLGERIAERLRKDLEKANAGDQQGQGAGAGADDRGEPGQARGRKARAAGGSH